jgi:hypothetical protein
VASEPGGPEPYVFVRSDDGCGANGSGSAVRGLSARGRDEPKKLAGEVRLGRGAAAGGAGWAAAGGSLGGALGSALDAAVSSTGAAWSNPLSRTPKPPCPDEPARWGGVPGVYPAGSVGANVPSIGTVLASECDTVPVPR